MKNNSDKVRLDWIDILRGIGMLLVVLGHTFINKNIIFKYIYSFHMPFFFVISGLTCFFEKEMTLKVFLKKKVKALLIPYFVMNVISIGIRYVFEIFSIVKSVKFLEYIPGVLYSNNSVFSMPSTHTWFITTLLLVEVLFYFLRKISKNDFQLFILTIICGLIGYVNCISIYRKRGPWHLETVFTAVVFYFLGYMFMKYYPQIKKIFKNKFDMWISAISLGIVGGIFALINERVTLFGNIYGSIIYFYISAICTIVGIFILVFLCYKFLKKIRIFEGVGKHCMFYIGYHALFIIVLKNYIKPILTNDIYAMLIGIGLYLIIYPLSYLADRYLPILVGKIKKSN